MSGLLQPIETAEEFGKAFRVSRETLARLEAYAALLTEWQGRFNLIAASTLPLLWHRHMADSAQLAAFVPEAARSLVDLGSGAGFPGLVLAILLAERPGFRAHLIEATGKKASFLEAVVAETGAPATVVNGRAEAVPAFAADVVTARACAKLPQLLTWGRRFAGPQTLGLFPKGRGALDELTVAGQMARLDVHGVPSVTESDAIILIIRSLGAYVRH